MLLVSSLPSASSSWSPRMLAACLSCHLPALRQSGHSPTTHPRSLLSADTSVCPAPQCHHAPLTTRAASLLLQKSLDCSRDCSVACETATASRRRRQRAPQQCFLCASSTILPRPLRRFWIHPALLQALPSRPSPLWRLHYP